MRSTEPSADKRDMGLDGATVHRPLHAPRGEVDRRVMPHRIVRHVEDQFVGRQRPGLVRARVDLVRRPPIDDERIGAGLVRWRRLIERRFDERLRQRRNGGQRIEPVVRSASCTRLPLAMSKVKVR